MLHYHKPYILLMCYHFQMTPRDLSPEERKTQLLEEICENTRAIRRVVNRILDHLHESADIPDELDYDPDDIDWEELDNHDDMFL
jgi:hypothetical protein